MRTFVLGLVALTLLIPVGTVTASPTSNPASYPLSTCIVSGETLGSHAEPYHHQVGEREILLCCEDCVAAFEKDTAGYLAELDQEIISAQADGYALETCVISGEPLDSMGQPAPILIGNRMVQLCCAGCTDAAQADPEAALAQADAAVITAQMETYPSEVCPISGNALGSMGDAYDYVFAGKLVRFCCAGCIDKFDANPGAAMDRVYSDAEPAAAKKGDHAGHQH